jgi:hypothetical protein
VEHLTPRMLLNATSGPMFAQQLGRISPQALRRFEQRRREAEVAGQAGAR